MHCSCQLRSGKNMTTPKNSKQDLWTDPPPNPFKNPPINPPTFYFFTWKGGGWWGNLLSNSRGVGEVCSKGPVEHFLELQVCMCVLILRHAIFNYVPLAIFGWKKLPRVVPPSALQHLHRSSKDQMMFPAQKGAGEALEYISGLVVRIGRPKHRV